MKKTVYFPEFEIDIYRKTNNVVKEEEHTELESTIRINKKGTWYDILVKDHFIDVLEEGTTHKALLINRFLIKCYTRKLFHDENEIDKRFEPSALQISEKERLLQDPTLGLNLFSKTKTQ